MTMNHSTAVEWYFKIFSHKMFSEIFFSIEEMSNPTQKYFSIDNHLTKNEIVITEAFFDLKPQGSKKAGPQTSIDGQN